MRLHFTILRLAFCNLDHHVGDLGVHWDTKGDSLGSRVGVPQIFSGFGEPVGSRFLSVCWFFLATRLSILRVSSEMCFLVGLGQKMMPGSVVGCAENIVNTVVSLGFTFSRSQ